MEKLLGLSNYIPISLGYSCYPAMFITKLGLADSKFYERYVFDWLGTSMWSICKVMENDFADFVDRESLVERNHNSLSKECYITNTKNNIIFLHDFHYLDTLTDEFVKGVRDKYARRIERFTSVLASEQRILFIRLERWRKDLINFPEYGITESEDFYMRAFSKRLQEKGTKFKILYLTTSNPSSWDPETRICYVNFTPNPLYKQVDELQLREIIKNNIDFIKASLQEQA
jgi:hypothetical protein